MRTRRTKKIHRGNKPTTKFGETHTPGGTPPRNHRAGVKRSMRKLKELMCEKGHFTDGEACATCESTCAFGLEYLDRKRDGEKT